MTTRFKRSYSLTLSVVDSDRGVEEVFTISNLKKRREGNNEVIERIERPIGIAFSIEKSIEGGRSTMNLDISNLSSSLRSKLDKQREQDKYIKASLSIGYQTSLREVYFGTVSKAESAKSGADIITSIECLDGLQALETSYTAKTIDAGVDINTDLSRDAESLEIGKISYDKKLTRPKVFVGNTVDLLEKNKASDGFFFIDGEKIYILKQGDFVEAFVPTVSADTGLISTPTLEAKLVTFRTQINAAIRLGGRVKIVSKTNPRVNGVYFVRRMNIEGDIYGQEWIQDVTVTPENLSDR